MSSTSSAPPSNILTYIRSAYNLDKIPSENIHITISDEDVFIHIKVNEGAAPPVSAAAAAAAGGGTLKKKRSLKSAKKAKTTALSDQQIHHKEHKDPTADE